MATFNGRLKELRLSQDLSQQELADEIKVSKSSISMLENGKRIPSFEVQELLADYFNVDLDYLMGRSDKTTVVIPLDSASPERRYLMAKIAKASESSLIKLKHLWEVVESDNMGHSG